jgi:peptidyl-tRNA hydrolase, PTH2 family
MKDIKQVIVMRTDLNMRKGKMIAQGAHAAMMFMTDKVRRQKYESNSQLEINIKVSLPELIWITDIFKKVCVRVDSYEELLEIKTKAQAAGLICHLCVDAGITEFGGVATATCLAIGPDYSEKIDEITGELKLL